MSQGKTYEQLRREALAWSPQQGNNEISTNSTTMTAGRGGGRSGRGYRGRGGGRSQSRGRTHRDDHKNRIFGQEYKDRKDLVKVAEEEEQIKSTIKITRIQ